MDLQFLLFAIIAVSAVSTILLQRRISQLQKIVTYNQAAIQQNMLQSLQTLSTKLQSGLAEQEHGYSNMESQ